jgi:uncharacterized protein DUF4386
MLRLSDSRNFSRTLTGLCLIGGPLALTAAAVIGPEIDDDNKVQELQNIALHHRRYVVAILLFFVGGVLIMLAGIGLVRLFRSVRVTLGQVAGALLTLGAGATMGFYAFSAIEYEMTRHDLNRVQMAKLLDETESAVFVPILIMFLLGIVIGSLLLAIAAFRRGLIPIWASVAIVAAAVLGFFEDSKPLEIAGFALLIVGLGTLGLRCLRMTDDEWDTAPAPPPATAAPPVA